MPSHETNWKDSIVRLGKALQVPELRSRLTFVAWMFGLYVLGLHVPAPFVDSDALQELGGGLFGFLNVLSGGAFQRVSILALGIIPYINASIIMQLLGIAIPSIQRLQKEGATGQKTIAMYTRWLTVLFAVMQASGLGVYLYSTGALTREVGPVIVVPLVIVMAAGTSFLMWLGEQLTDKGIGNGVSLIIFAGIMVGFPVTLWQIGETAWGQYNQKVYAVLLLAAIIAIFLAIVVFITYVYQAIRRIPIQHAKRVVGNRVFSSANTYLPLKVVTAGVIPIIFAISLVMLPATLAQFLEGMERFEGAAWLDVLRWFSPGYGGPTWFAPYIGGITYFLLVVFFTYFYTAVMYNVQDIADNLKKQGSFVPGLRPGKQTEKYIDQVLTRITFAGAIFLGVVALMPYIIPSFLGSAGSAAQFFPLWGGTSLLIVVSVGLETMKNIEAHLTMRHYEGFIK